MMFLWLFLFKFFIRNGKGVVIFTVNFPEKTLETAAEKITALFFFAARRTSRKQVCESITFILSDLRTGC